jgi:site-specific recombinase XerD
MTIRHRLSNVRTFFERIMEWDYDDAPARLFIYMSDFPALDEPLPRFLDDPTAAKFMATLAQDKNLRHRLMVELLARTGMRVGELADYKMTPWCKRATATVCGSPSANCTTTATSLCSRCWSTSSASTRPCADAHAPVTS